MAILRSNRIVNLNSSGEVISEEWQDPLDTIRKENADACYAQLEQWQEQAKRSYHASITTIRAPSTPQVTPKETPFGFDYSSRPSYGARRHKIFSRY